MPKIVGGIAALVALIAGMLGQVDPVACLTRAALAFILGWLGAEVWYVLFKSPVRRRTQGESQASTQAEDKN